MTHLSADLSLLDSDVTLPRRGMLHIVAVIALTCGLGGLVIGYSHYRAIKQLNPRALDPMVAMTLSLLGYAFTGGILSFFVDWHAWKCLADHAEMRRSPKRNPNLFAFSMLARIGGLLSLWFSWTGLLGIAAVGCAIGSTYLIQKELELYTDPA